MRHSTSMLRSVVIALGGATALALVAFGLFAGLAVTQTFRALRATQAQAAADQATYRDAVMADQRRWQADPLFARRDGGDASPLLAEAIGYHRRPASKPLPEAITAGLRDAGLAWPRSKVDVSGVDLSFFASLGDAGSWNLEAPGTPLFGKPLDPNENEPLNVVVLQEYAKLRLLRGLETGALRQALDDVHELARLCLTTESLMVTMTAVPLLDFERRAAAEATARGLDLGGFQAPTEEDVASLRRTLMASLHATSLVAPAEPLDPAFPLVARCAALDRLREALFIRPFARVVLPERYAALGKALDGSDCRLRRLRRAWATPGEGELTPKPDDRLCYEPYIICLAPETTVRLNLPFMRPAFGAKLVLDSTWPAFKGYADGGTK
ncbi:MAG: hypothetical protein INH41_16435 [Myxococcaceae bacterium]|jgi:hypothetical protein|nr:hypothetical protein [Myxococcaceae bacterium]MCA3013969.1 hypothetical protein [Myxococcaceae bacterium]